MKKYKLQVGDRVKRETTAPVLHLNYSTRPDCGAPFIWIGNVAPGNSFCLATLAGVSRLRALARAINAACDHYAQKMKAEK